MCYIIFMKLSAWAKTKGISYRSAWKMHKSNKLPVRSEQLPNGTILVFPEDEKIEQAAIYARVSSGDQKKDLDRQLLRLVDYAIEHRIPIAEKVKEVGSGMNGQRKGLLRLLANKNISIIIVEHRDRLTRFGFSYLEASLKSSGRKIIVVDSTEIQDDIVRDLHEVIVSMCARLYGKRSAKNKADKAISAINKDVDNA